MYESHFGLRQRPFPVVPDPDCYYPATGHEQALSQLLQAIQDEEGLALLAGAPGTGKTLVGHCLLDRLGDQAASAFLTNSRLGNRSGLLRALLHDLALPYDASGEEELQLVLTNFLLKNYEGGKRAVLVIDEAQHLTVDLLEELRLLTNLEGQKGKAAQVVLLAQTAIFLALEQPELAGFNQRLGVRCQLEPLGIDEAADYLVHHLRVQGGMPQEIMSDEALELLTRATGGVPRLLNRAGHQALSLAFSAGANLVDAEVALEALTILGLDNTTIEPPSPGVNATAAGEPVAIEVSGENEEASSDAEGGAEHPLPPALAKESERPRRLFATPRRPA
jgi:type II secretory pathway predicted ATPase ExeA